MNTPIGRILLPATGTGVAGYTVLLTPEAVQQVAVGVPVAADTDDGRVIGLITDITTVGTDNDPVLAANITTGQMPALVDETRQAVIATVQTFHSPALRPVRAGVVWHGTPDDVATMTGADRIACPVPAGAIACADGTWAPIVLSSEELLGPLAAHFLVGGRSGAAAKTSYVGVLLASTLAAAERAGRTCGALLFNVKGVDLLALDQPATTALDDDDVALYEALGIPAAPFNDVTYYAPMLPGGYGTRSRRIDAVGIRWGLRDVWPYLSLLDRRFTDNDLSVGLMADLRTKVDAGTLTTVDGVAGFLANELETAEEADRGHIWRSHATATARKLLRAFRSLPKKTGGLVAGGEAGHGVDVPTRLSAGEVVVVDIAGLDPLVQGAVVARTCRRLLEAAEDADGGGVGVEHLVIFADELNMFAPAQGGDEVRRVRDGLVRIATTGRYAGISLWGAAQFPSTIAGAIRDNASTLAIGTVAETELDSGVYGRLPAGVREQIVTAARGSMCLRSANLRSWTPVRFPRPAWAAGAIPTAAMRSKPRSVDALPLSAQAVANLAEGVHPDVVDEVVAAVDGDPAAAAAALEAVNVPDMRRITGGEPSSGYQQDNPWAVLDD